MKKFELIDENDPFFKTPKEANSRTECPYEIGSDEWLEWQRDFAWREYSKPSGQERVEAAYQRLKDRGFQIVRSLPPTNFVQNKVRVLFLPNEGGYFEDDIKAEIIERSYGHILIPWLRNSPSMYRMIDNDPTASSITVKTKTFRLHQCYSLFAYIASEWPAPSMVLNVATEYLAGAQSSLQLYRTIERYRDKR